MNWKKESKTAVLLLAGFICCFYLPVGNQRFDSSVMESLRLLRWYAREHVLLCLMPAFFIAGAISVFISQAAVMKYLGARASKVVAYGVASVSGSILAVCSCTVLPLFAGIWRMGAGLGPATAFLYSGPAINVLAIILTARILGPQLGAARAVGAITFSIVIGLIMHFIFRREELEKAAGQMHLPETGICRPLWQNAVFFALMVGILVFANWGAPNDFIITMKRSDARLRAAIVQKPDKDADKDGKYRLKLLAGEATGRELVLASDEIMSATPAPGTWTLIWHNKWRLTGGLGLLLGAVLVAWLGIPLWKVLAAAGPTLALALLLPMHGIMVLIPFAAGLAGLATITSTTPGEPEEWFGATWGFAKQILPLLMAGVVIAGMLLGRPGHQGLIPSAWVNRAVGGNSLSSNLFASIAGAFMYFATLTEVPILQGLIGAGMGKGPALALLLAGPALSLPNMLVIRSVMGTKKTVVYVSLVVVMSTAAGMVFGALT